jgi:hypothetical protein
MGVGHVFDFLFNHRARNRAVFSWIYFGFEKSLD